MEGGKNSEQKVGSNEVVVSILGIEETSKLENQSGVCRSLETLESVSSSKNTPIGSPNTGLTELQILKSSVQLSTSTNSFNPEITNLGTTPNSNKPPKIPDESVIRRRSLSKPKSRLVEPPYLNVTKLAEESSKSNTSTPKETVKTAPVTPKTPLLASPGGEEEEDDEDVYNYKTANLKPDAKVGNKLKGVVLLEWISLVCIMGVLIASSTVDRLQNHRIWSLEIWKWCVLVLVVFCGRLFTGWFINITVFLIERNFLLKKKVLYFVYGLKKSVRVFIWLCLILLAWVLLINRGVRRSRDAKRTLNYITRALASTLFGAGLWMLKTLLVKLLASSFHVTRFFDRIQESIFHQYVLQTLSGPPLMDYAERVGKTNSGRLSFKNPKKDKEGKKEEVNVEKLQKMKQETISAWTMRGLIQVIQGSGLYTISNALEDCVDDEGEQKDKEITNEWEAKAAAYRIFQNVARPGHKYIDEEDLLHFMKKEEVDNVLPLIEGATETGKIRKSSLRNWVMVVEEMNILTTVFLRYDNEKIFYPNSVLATKPISNFYRSPEMSDAVEFAIDVSTSAQNIVDLKAKIKAYLEGKSQHWRPTHSVQVKDIEDVNKMKMALYVNHTMNFQNFGEKSNRRSELVLELKRIFEELKIKYNLLPQEVHLRYVGSAPPTSTNA
ncbi:mechanosensitive channel of small conductance-like 9 [Actinidia rufa]|uniref:Mechanosensitive ion channel protein n=1 Tax=Actinidia rufa TaxID=165716 RepID=A0A7J0FII0_9ERIC|nr:mechanosensitive channel of small conductance-like 9 [Actinidia rufa]